MPLPPRAYVFIGLNVLRALSILSLILVFCSNIVTLANDIKAVNRFMAGEKLGDLTNSTLTDNVDTNYIMGSTVPNQPAGAFWAVLNRLFIIFQAVLLVLAEIGFPSVFFDRFFPVLGKTFGLGALGLMQMLIGAAVLSHHVDTFTLVSAFFLFAIGSVNCLAGLIFRERAKSKRSLTSWRDHAKSALPTHIGGVKVTAFSPSSMMSSPPSFVSNLRTGMTSSSTNTHDSDSKDGKFAGLGFGRQGEKAAGLKGFLISKPVEALPKYLPGKGNAI